MPRAETSRAVAPYDQQLQQNPLWDMQRRMNAEFNRMLRDPFGALTTSFGGGNDASFGLDTFGGSNFNQQLNSMMMVPAMDVRDCGDKLCVSCELPGLRKEDVNIELHRNRLTISGQRKEEAKREGENWITQERRFGKFSRTIAVPEGVRPENVSAQFNDGMLELSIQKPPPAEPVHRIQLQGGQQQQQQQQQPTTTQGGQQQQQPSKESTK